MRDQLVSKNKTVAHKIVQGNRITQPAWKGHNVSRLRTLINDKNDGNKSKTPKSKVT